MYGEIDLEAYTIAVVRLNSAFEKLEDNAIDEVSKLFKESYSDLEKLYKDTVEDLNQDEVNLNEYYLFFQNGKQTFPQYIEALGNIEVGELQDEVNNLLNVFSNLNKIAEGFSRDDLSEFK